MKKSISIWAFPGMELKDAAKLAKDAGFEAIELGVAEEGDIALESKEEEVKKIGDMIRKTGLEVASLATGLFWKYSMTSSKKENVEKVKEVCRKMLDIASWIGTDGILVIPGGVGADFIPGFEVVSYDRAYDRAQNAIKEIAPYAEKKKVNIGIENVWNKFLLSPLEMKKFIDEIASPFAGVYFDVGNVVINGYPEQWIRILGKRIKKVHFKDFKRAIGNISGFVDLLEGDVNWPEVIKAFKEIGYDGYFTAEFFGYKTHNEALIYNTSRAMDFILGR